MKQEEVLLRELLSKPNAYHRSLVPIAGVTGAVMLSQMIYWSKNKASQKRDGWFYKTQDEWEEETGLTRYEQETVREKLTKLNILKEERRGVPAKLWFKLDWSRLQKTLIDQYSVQIAEKPHTSMRKSNNLDCGKVTYKNAGIPQSITKNTTKNTTETTTSFVEVEENTQKKQPNPKYQEWLQQKKENQAKKTLKDKHGGSIPPWVNVQEAVDKITHKPASREDTQKFLDVFNESFDRQFRITKEKRVLLGKRLETFSLEEILEATRSMGQSAFHRGDNDSNWRATPSFVLKDDETVDKWVNNAKKDQPKVLPNGNIMKKMLINGKMRWTEVAVNRLEDLTGKDKEIALEQIEKYKELKEKNAR